MKTRTIQLFLIIFFGMLVFAPLSSAKEKSYNYIVAYSLKKQLAYYVPTFQLNVKGDSYNDEEYVSDTETVLKMEGEFQNFLENTMGIRIRDITVSARVAYKTKEIADKKLEKEIGDFRFRGFEIQEVTKFKYDD